MGARSSEGCGDLPKAMGLSDAGLGVASMPRLGADAAKGGVWSPHWGLHLRAPTLLYSKQGLPKPQERAIFALQTHDEGRKI